MKELIEKARWDGMLKALKATFAADAPDEVRELIGGGSTSKMFKLKVGTKYYVLRLMGLDQPLEERRIQAECAQYGARLNIAPHCYYVDVTDGILIMDFVTCATLTKDIILDKMPKLLNNLRYSEKISPPFYEIFTYMTDFIEKISKITPDRRIINYYQAIIEVMSILADHRQLASCHNDLKRPPLRKWGFVRFAHQQKVRLFLSYLNLVSVSEQSPTFVKGVPAKQAGDLSSILFWLNGI